MTDRARKSLLPSNFARWLLRRRLGAGSVAASLPESRAGGIKFAPAWSLAAPLAGLPLLALTWPYAEGALALMAAVALLSSVLAAVHHAEVIALKVGEPYGTLVLALAITVLEAGLIITLMLADPSGKPTLARDALFAAVMLILTGITGLCLLVGAARHHVQRFGVYGVNAALAALTTIVVVVFVLPNFTSSATGPIYSSSQLALAAVICLLLYGTFVLIQTVRHRDYLLPLGRDGQPLAGHIGDEQHAVSPTTRQAWTAFAALVLSLTAVVGLAKTLSGTIGAAVEAVGAPEAVIGVAIAFLVLLPESIAAVRNARADRLQTSLNLALGSALATIGLTTPVLAILALLFDWTLVLGLDVKNMVLLALALLVATQSLATGRTTVMQGVVHLVLFGLFLFLTVVP